MAPESGAESRGRTDGAIEARQDKLRFRYRGAVGETVDRRRLRVLDPEGSGSPRKDGPCRLDSRLRKTGSRLYTPSERAVLLRRPGGVSRPSCRTTTPWTSALARTRPSRRTPVGRQARSEPRRECSPPSGTCGVICGEAVDVVGKPGQHVDGYEPDDDRSEAPLGWPRATGARWTRRRRDRRFTGSLIIPHGPRPSSYPPNIGLPDHC